MRALKKDFVILSAERPNKNNTQRTETLKHVLNDLKLPYVECDGMYKGTKEKSFLVIVNDNTEKEILVQIAFNQFNQESILYRDSLNGIELIFEDKIQPLEGTFQKVDSVDGLDAYTILNGENWVIK